MEETSKEQLVSACLERVRLRDHSDVQQIRACLYDLFDGDGFSITLAVEEEQEFPDIIPA